MYNASPFIKWAGGKTSLASYIVEYLSTIVDAEQALTYYKPFLGSGAVFFALAKRYTLSSVLLIDSNTALIDAYSKNTFDDTEQVRLSNVYITMSRLGATCILSNSDPKNIHLDDTFFDDLYKTYTIERISARRSINSDATKRHALTELLITNK